MGRHGEVGFVLIGHLGVEALPNRDEQFKVDQLDMDGRVTTSGLRICAESTAIHKAADSADFMPTTNEFADLRRENLFDPTTFRLHLRLCSMLLVTSNDSACEASALLNPFNKLLNHSVYNLLLTPIRPL